MPSSNRRLSPATIHPQAMVGYAAIVPKQLSPKYLACVNTPPPVTKPGNMIARRILFVTKRLAIIYTINI